jgi:dolichol-phosphate mannosyltransferase
MLNALALLQFVLALGVVRRFLARRRPLVIHPARAPAGGVTILVPVLNEEARLPECLASLVQQGPEVAAILIVDGGSTDGTRAVVARLAKQDPRIRWVEAGPPPAGWNGKAWNLEVGRQQASTPWLLTIDADVRAAPALAGSLVAFAERHCLAALSVATSQCLAGWLDAILHPAMLTTLVYRLGPPGGVATSVATAQANGQCFLLAAQPLAELGGFFGVRSSRCEDITLARLLVAAGERVGMFEAPGLVAVRMYDSARMLWENWPRSLPLRDRFGWGLVLRGVLDVALVQAAPLFVLPLAWWRGARLALLANLTLGLLRLGTLSGTARAYPSRPWSFWLSPLADGPVLVALLVSLVRRRPRWRGRPLVAETCS